METGGFSPFDTLVLLTSGLVQFNKDVLIFEFIPETKLVANDMEIGKNITFMHCRSVLIAKSTKLV
jgi:hypothetical protein